MKLKRGELGLERLCVKCKDYWPLDDEFWFVLTDGRLHSYCKACCTQRRRELKMKLKDFEIDIIRNLDAQRKMWDICIKVSCQGELVDYEMMEFSTLNTPNDINIDIKNRIEKIRNEFERIL
jgi:hypothetical protein